MGLATIAAIVTETHEKLVRAGLDDAVVTAALMKAEAEMVRAEIESMCAFRDRVKTLGAAVVAERIGITPRAVRKRLQKALNEIGTAKAA